MNLLIATIIVLIIIVLIIVLVRQGKKKHYKEMMKDGATPEQIEEAIAGIPNPTPIDTIHRINNRRIMDLNLNNVVGAALRNIAVETFVNPMIRNIDLELDDAYALVQLVGLLDDGPRIIQTPKVDVAPLIAGSATKEEATTKITNAYKAVTSDSQNVHDTTFNKEMRAKIRMLLEKCPENARDKTATLESLSKSIPPEVYNMLSIDLPFSVGDGTATELEILNAVAARSADPSLEESTRKALKESLISALNDCVDDNNGMVVCMNGRVARVVESLTMLDPLVGFDSAMTSDMYKNQIFEEVRGIIGWHESLDPPSHPDEIKKAIDNHLEQYREKLTAAMFDFVRDGCHAAVL